MATINTANTICLSPQGVYLRREDLAATAILPGHFLQRNPNGQVAIHQTADGKPARLIVADISIGDAGDVSREYQIGETVHYVTLVPGEYVTLRVGASQTITQGGELASAGDGTVKTPAAAGVGVLFIADEAITTGAGDDAYIRATVANF